MVITKLEKCTAKKTRVYIDEEYSFLLYPQDIRTYALEEGMELSKDLYNQIMEEIVVKRAKQKAMALLKKSDQTEKELCLKLKQAEYPQAALERAIEYVKSYGYMNDDRYLEQYIYYKKGTKSIRIMEIELKQKGFSKEQIRKQMEREEVTDEIAIQKAIRKKIGTRENLTFEEIQKVAAYLYRKGFKEEDIRTYLWNKMDCGQ